MFIIDPWLMWNFVATVTVLMLLNMDIVCPFLSVGKLLQVDNLYGFVCYACYLHFFITLYLLLYLWWFPQALCVCVHV